MSLDENRLRRKEYAKIIVGKKKGGERDENYKIVVKRDINC